MARIIGCLLLEPIEACAQALDAARSHVGTQQPATRAPRTATRVDAPHWQARPLAQRSLAGKPLVEWVVRRASEAQQLDALIVVVPETATVESFKESLPAAVEVWQAKRGDRLGRLVETLAWVSGTPSRPQQAASVPHVGDRRGMSRQVASDLRGPNRLGTDLLGVVTLRLDCPLLDPCLLDQLVSAVRANPAMDGASYVSSRPSCSKRDRSLPNGQLGLYADYFRGDMLKQLDEQLTDPAARQQFESYVWNHSSRYALTPVPLPEALDRDDLRFSLRHQDDWAHAEQIVEALGQDHLEWHRLVGLMQTQPNLLARMASLNLAEREGVSIA